MNMKETSATTPVMTQVSDITEPNRTSVSVVLATAGTGQTGEVMTPTTTDFHPRPYVNMIYFNWRNYCYNAAESATLIVDGNFNGVERICYKGGNIFSKAGQKPKKFSARLFISIGKHTNICYTSNRSITRRIPQLQQICHNS